MGAEDSNSQTIPKDTAFNMMLAYKDSNAYERSFENYLDISPVLLGDLDAMTSGDIGSLTQEQWGRNFIRASIALIEGYSYALWEMIPLVYVCIDDTLTKPEIKFVFNEGAVDTKDRIRLSLILGYRLHGLSANTPDFTASGWASAICTLRKRHALLHPKSVADLRVDQGDVKQAREGLAWLLEQYTSMFALLLVRHADTSGTKSNNSK